MRASSSLPRGVRRRLEEAVDLAGQRVEASPLCQALFDSLSPSAERALALTLYAPAWGPQERRICSGRVVAFTEVGSRVTYLCRGFGRLSPRRAATTVLREALHLAGLEESPVTPGAWSSAEITDLVADRCDL